MNEEKNIKSPLPGFSKENPFKTPYGYFENLQSNIEARIEAENEVVSRKVQILRILKPVLSMAASFALIFLLVYYPLNKFLPKYLSSGEIIESTEVYTEEDYLASSMDENYFFETLLEEEKEELLPSNEVYAYLSVEMTEYDFYTEMIKN